MLIQPARLGTKKLPAAGKRAIASAQRFGLLVVSIVAVAMLLIPRQAAPGALVWNFTPSVPLGLYHIDHEPWAPGDRVAIRPTGKLADDLARSHVLEADRLLLKRVAAAKGDTVCRHGQTILINEIGVARAKSADSRGQSLPGWTGCQRLGVGQVLLLGEIAESFDGRYFGPTDAGDIVGRISPVILLPNTRSNAGFASDDGKESADR